MSTDIKKSHFFCTASGPLLCNNESETMRVASASKPALMLAFLIKYSDLIDGKVYDSAGIGQAICHGPFDPKSSTAWKVLEGTTATYSVDKIVVRNLATLMGAWSFAEIAAAMMAPDAQSIENAIRSIGLNKNDFDSPVYNSATNLAMLALGGPAGASSAIAKLGFDGAGDIIFNRYMWEPRANIADDNTATAKSLAHMMQFINCYEGKIGTTAKNALNAQSAPFSKNGILKSLPPVHAMARCIEHSGTKIFYGMIYNVPSSSTLDYAALETEFKNDESILVDEAKALL
ncbi:hypothetical protein [Aurantiacibacter sp. D1-12]|uniref:hypothetical protein n=1 Tax=Aurantiacibacter sp. D1-12 TaxID=2993658 RepID=UPI00237CB984|nr:hypothetical protein [Aurantiacibacter sp. D1-12]MDE1468396.1 hypothetical protein [Aurantiacibacter sp. D1-12]